MNKHIYPVVLAILALILSGCVSVKPSYSLHDTKLVGTWMISERTAGLISTGEETYFPDGTLCGFGLDVYMRSSHLYVYKGRWEIKNSQLFTWEVSGDLPYITPGQRITDDIKELNSVYMKLHETDDPGPDYYRYKLPYNRGDQLCIYYGLLMPEIESQ